MGRKEALGPKRVKNPGWGRVGEGVGEMDGLRCRPDPHRLLVHLWEQKAKEGRAGIPRAGSLGTLRLGP